MILSLLVLKNFRTHNNIEFQFSDTLNYIVGGNGQGKTSVLESIYYLCTTKSFRSKDSEAVSFNENDFEIKGSFKDITRDNVRVLFSQIENKKYYFQNDKIISRNAEIIGRFPVVILTPADHAITQGSPSDRRKFIDSTISQSSSTYLSLLLDYNRTLKQRSAILSLLKERYRSDLVEELDAWTEKLISAGTQIIQIRQSFVDIFNDYLKTSYKKILDDNETPLIKYYYLDGYDENDISIVFNELLMEKKEEEIRRAINLVGPHRDDLIFEINNLNLKTYGSQGQHKTFQTALRFAEFFYLKEMTGKSPIFLLDDVFGELDSFRSRKISQYLKEVGQAFITLTDFANIDFLSREKNDKVIKLEDNKAIYA